MSHSKHVWIEKETSIQVIYPLVMTNVAMENHHAINR